MYHGIINIYKEKGYTSHDVVAVLRGILGQKKIGHTGTLDPEATGVLPVCLGKGTKVAGLLTDKDKVYRVTFKLGQETDTQDHTGTVINEMSYDVTNEQVLAAIELFVGPIEQIPPMYSALKVNGKKLYELAREGKSIERKSRSIVVHEINEIQVTLPSITMTVHCSKGTYIRTLCRDIAESLGTCGHMTALERTQSGNFTLESALTLAQVKVYKDLGSIREHLVPIDHMFGHFTTIVIKESYYKLLDNGNKLPKQSFTEEVDLLDGQRFNVYNGERDYIGIFEWNATKALLVPIKIFFIRQERG